MEDNKYSKEDIEQISMDFINMIFESSNKNKKPDDKTNKELNNKKMIDI